MIKFYLAHFTVIDYAVLAGVLLLFFIFLALSIFVLIKRPLLGIFSVLLSLVFLLTAAIYSHYLVDNTVRKRSVTIADAKQLTFSDTLILDVNITNLSPNTLNYCHVDIKFYSKSSNLIKSYLNRLRPFYVASFSLEESIDENSSYINRINIDNFRPSNFEIAINSECF